MVSKQGFREEFVSRIESGFGGLTVRTVEGFDLADTLREMQVDHTFILILAPPMGQPTVASWPSYQLNASDPRDLIDKQNTWDTKLVGDLLALNETNADIAGAPAEIRIMARTFAEDGPEKIRIVVLMQNSANEERRKNPAFVHGMQAASYRGRSVNITYVIQTADVSMGIELTPYFPLMEFGTPDTEEISEIINSIISQVDPDVTPEAILPLAQACAGLTRREVEDIASLACHGKFHLDPDKYKEQKIRTAEADGLFRVLSSDSSDTELFGLDGLMKFTEPLLRHSDGVNPDLRPRGLLFLGPPGSGKTAAARYLAVKSHRTLCQVDFGSIRNKWVGETESRLDRMFKLVESLAPAVLFVD